MTKDEYHHKDLKDKLIREGSHLLASVGYDNFSLRQLSKNLGVSHAAPYRHFHSKEELVIRIVEKGLDEFYDCLYLSVKSFPDDPLLQLRDMGRQYILFFINNPDLVKIMFLNRENRDLAVRVSSKDSFKLLLDTVTACKDRGLVNASDPLLASLLIWGEVHGLSYLLMEGNIPFEGSIEDFVDVLVDGIMELIATQV